MCPALQEVATLQELLEMSAASGVSTQVYITADSSSLHSSIRIPGQVAAKQLQAAMSKDVTSADSSAGEGVPSLVPASAALAAAGTASPTTASTSTAASSRWWMFILLRGLVLWVAALGTMGGYMLGAHICPPGASWEPDDAGSMELRYNATVAASYEATHGKPLEEGEWPERQKLFEDAHLHVCKVAGRPPVYGQMCGSIHGWVYGQPMPCTEIWACWGCSSTISLLLSYLLGLIGALAAGLVVR